MNQENQTEFPESSRVAMAAIEAAKASLPENEFTLYLTQFNFHFLLCRLSMSQDFGDQDVEIVSSTLAKPLTLMVAGIKGVDEERTRQLHDQAFADVRAAIEAAAINTTAPLQAVIDRAEKEGFPVPTMEHMVQAAKRQNVDWKAVAEVSERFHFQAIVKRIVNGVSLPAAYAAHQLPQEE